jgi:hypothetical protein
MRASSSIRLTVSQRFRASWLSWRRRRTKKALRRAETRLLLLRLETDSQLLRVKELLALQQQLEHRAQETVEAEAWHRGHLLQEPPKLTQLLGSATSTPRLTMPTGEKSSPDSSDAVSRS